MKTLRLFGLELKAHLSIERVKRIEISIPDNADDCHLRQGYIGEWGTPDGKTKVCYYHGSKVTFIDIPECKRSVQVSLTPLRNEKRTAYSTNRKIVIDLYY